MIAAPYICPKRHSHRDQPQALPTMRQTLPPCRTSPALPPRQRGHRHRSRRDIDRRGQLTSTPNASRALSQAPSILPVDHYIAPTNVAASGGTTNLTWQSGLAPSSRDRLGDPQPRWAGIECGQVPIPVGPGSSAKRPLCRDGYRAGIGTGYRGIDGAHLNFSRSQRAAWASARPCHLPTARRLRRPVTDVRPIAVLAM